ncbi:MAG TPA: tRNA (guanosine(46)-N7)-methyltransferase TrmB [Bacteroidetes bacterium]|nr:tRNA (guanosine(46)-N7)-methyltransferase TrmB [Bacteroidota bacterium]
MSRRNKLQKFAEVLSFPNVYENFDASKPGLAGQGGTPVDLKGKWAAEHFKNNNPITLELACGKGEYTLGLATDNPGRNFIGVDIKGARIWRGAKTALEQGLENAAFLRTRIEQVNLFFAEAEVDGIWITFADPFLKKGKENRRLTSSFFLNLYEKILKPGGLVHLKTDDPTLYGFTLETLAKQQKYKLLYHDDDIYSKPLPVPELALKTFYEKQHLAAGKTIKYVRFQLQKGN